MKKIRQSQLISPWGVGQIVNFPNDVSLMVCGLDAWEESYKQAELDAGIEEFIIREERLEKQLGVSQFRLPPDYRKKEKGVYNTGITIPFVNFPLWYYCPRCGWMTKRSLYSGRTLYCTGTRYEKGLSCHEIKDYRRPRLIPVRFITVCEEGHIEDFPFLEWVHRGDNYDSSSCRLRMMTGRNSSLSGIHITCKCGASRSMAGAFGDGALEKVKECGGHRPWLGEVDNKAKGCGKNLTVVQKGASNVYFPIVKSAIYLPQHDDVDSRMAEILEKVWRDSGTMIEGSDEKTLEVLVHVYSKEHNVNSKKLLELIKSRLEQNRRNNQNIQKPQEKEESLDVKIRRPEYQAILDGVGGDRQDLCVNIKQTGEYRSLVSHYFNNIALVHKLKETRAFVGFTRRVPPDSHNVVKKKFDLTIKSKVNWLPAIVVRGEGIFIDFNRNKLAEWAERKSVIERVKTLENNLKRKTSYYDEKFKLNPKFVLLHTFAHLLINQLSFECGYGSSSLRERIYCSHDGSDEEMNGILIYTASNDSEGSLGGLVRQGLPGRLENSIYAALQNARWCSSDPVCIQSLGQGPDSCNLAACHNCTLLPETSCEFGNRMLDRALILGSDIDESIGYFSLSEIDDLIKEPSLVL
ncbi:DUF1998 domain-containing protein [Lihuaxuella thermophila]|uniref:MrfA-like Zn-binding domain-containing protein n=1 Tax=Lihuaxuella thermophila TaxID=1173111 RepID=A0A1H8JLM0_9BACL|nr:DUF1998 domain-containing protein [Lihuaxuella thermophila]SEN81664.1 protein of unknown function [Lihuaxuella thermophila]